MLPPLPWGTPMPADDERGWSGHLRAAHSEELFLKKLQIKTTGVEWMEWVWNESCLSKQDTDALPPSFGENEGNRSEHKICATVMLKPASGPPPHTSGAHTCRTHERKSCSLFPTTCRKALKSSKVKLVTLQIQNDLLTCSKYTRSEFKNKLNSIHYIRLAQLQFSFKKIFVKY